MSETLQGEIGRMRGIMEQLERRLSTGEVAQEKLADFKSAVDEIRLRVWALLAAAGSEDPRDAAERFRLRRVAEICRGVSQELLAGRLSSGYPEWPEVQQTASELSATIARQTGHAA